MQALNSGRELSEGARGGQVLVHTLLALLVLAGSLAWLTRQAAPVAGDAEPASVPMPAPPAPLAASLAVKAGAPVELARPAPPSIPAAPAAIHSAPARPMPARELLAVEKLPKTPLLDANGLAPEPPEDAN